MKKFINKVTDEYGNEGDVLFERMTGSRMYGTSYEKGEHPFNPDYVSDYDFRGLFMVDPLHKIKLAPFNKFSETIKLEEFDSEMYEIQKFFFEAGRNNPNYMDLLFGDKETLIGSSAKGDLILNNKNIFLSNKIAESFSGYAESQLHRIKNHNRWFNKYPHIYDVEITLKEAFSRQETDHNMIANLFSGQLARSITSENPNDKKVKSNLTSNEMMVKYFSKKTYDVLEYTKPHVLNFMKVQTNVGRPVQIDKELTNYFTNQASFRASNKSLYFIFDGGVGLFTEDGNMQPRSQKQPHSEADIRYIVSVDVNHLKKYQDIIKDLWSWKINRNQTRSALEERFGYDVKHGMHTYRLLDSAIDVLNNGTYNPRLTGQKLQNAKDILSGQWSYDELLNQTSLKLTELRKLKKLNLLQPEVDEKKLAEIYNEIVFKSESQKPKKRKRNTMSGHN